MPRPTPTPRLVRIRRLVVTAMLVTLPAWAFFLYVANFSDSSGFTDDDRAAVFAVVATLITSVVALIPTAQELAARAGRAEGSWTSVEAAVVALAGCGSSISVVLNGGRSTRGLETIIGVAIALTGAAGIYGFTRVASTPSPAGVTQRASAEALIRRQHAPSSISGGEQDQARKVLEARAEIGRQDIAEGFRRYGDANEASARWFLLAGVVLFAGSVSAAVLLVGRLGEQASVAAILTRAAITLPGALVFGVFIREAAARRRYAAWGGLIAIQAEHLGAFTADMRPDDRNELEMQFARSVFRGGDVALEQGSEQRTLLGKRSGATSNSSPGSPVDTPIKALAEILTLATSAADLAKSVQELSRAAGKEQRPHEEVESQDHKA